MKKINWQNVAAWAAIILMAIMYLSDKFSGNAEAMDLRVKEIEKKIPVIENTIAIELRNMNDRLKAIERKLP